MENSVYIVKTKSNQEDILKSISKEVTIDDKWRERAERIFKERCLIAGVRWGSSEYFTLQAEFFSGAMSIIEEVPVYWALQIMCSREIIPEY